MLNRIETAKIAFVGADNDKKIEIAKALDQYLYGSGYDILLLNSDLPVIKRNMGITLENNSPELQFALQWSLLSSQMAKERAIIADGRGFISDCCVIDYLAGAIQKVEDNKLSSSSMSLYFQIAREHIKKYDVVAYVPFTFDFKNTATQITNWHDNMKRKRLNEIIYGELIKNNVKFITMNKVEIQSNVDMIDMYLKNFM